MTTTYENKVKILHELMADNSEMFLETRKMFDLEWQTQKQYEVAWALLLSDGSVQDTGFDSLEQIRKVWEPGDDSYYDSEEWWQSKLGPEEE